MRLLCLGDLHLRVKGPRIRVDSYFDTQFRKLKFIFDTFYKKKCDYILQPGDFFDSPDASYYLTNSLLELILKFNILGRILCVLGQHDMHYRALKVDNTPLGIFQTLGLIRILDKDPLILPKEMSFYGCSFSQEIPNIITKNRFNVLLIHKMIITKKLWPTQTNFIYARDFLKKYDFDLVVSGDNHNFFIEEYNGKFLINCGSLMRMSVDQTSFEPSIVVFDTDTKEYETIKIPIEPSERVMDITKFMKERESKLELEKFVESLKRRQIEGFSFLDALDEVLKEEKECVRDLILSFLKETKNARFVK